MEESGRITTIKILYGKQSVRDKMVCRSRFYSIVRPRLRDCLKSSECLFFVFLITICISVSRSESLLRDAIVDTDNFVLIQNIDDKAEDNKLKLDPSASLIWGPGLLPTEIVLPSRYFYIHFVGTDGQKLNSSVGFADDLKIRIDCDGDRQIYTNILDRKDGSFIVRYKLYQSCRTNFRIIVTYLSHHLAKSPYIFTAPVHPDQCNCPQYEVDEWTAKLKCPARYEQMERDLRPFPKASVHFETVVQRTIEKFHLPRSHSFCHYAVTNNQVYRKCYGEHVGFHIFPDAILQSFTRKLYLPDFEFIMNLGDWPLVDKKRIPDPIPIWSWCKTNDTYDILLPTYELTEASLEAMGRVTLDMMTVQSNTEVEWEDKIPKLFWRGRDSRQERLDLIHMGRDHPDLFNVSLTNFFFFRDQEHIYGPKQEPVSFFRFFDYKYQLNLDGTVAAYRFPFLLAGDAVTFKVHSKYIEHFYSDLKPWVHYIPVKSGLGDLVDKIKWALVNDDKAKAIGRNGRKYAQDHLMPVDVFCYYVTLYKEWSRRLAGPVVISPEMELVKPQKLHTGVRCDCQPKPRDVNPNLEEKVEL